MNLFTLWTVLNQVFAYSLMIAFNEAVWSALFSFDLPVTAVAGSMDLLIRSEKFNLIQVPNQQPPKSKTRRQSIIWRQ